MEKKKTKIFCFLNGSFLGDVAVSSLGEDGRHLCSHVSSNEEWAKRDIGYNSGSSHNIYKAYYPGGYEMVWVNDINDPEFQKAVKAVKTFKRDIDWDYKYNGKGMTVKQFWLDILGWKNLPKFTDTSRPCADARWKNIPLPQSDEEFAYLTEKTLGKPLHFRELSLYYFELEENYKDYNDPVFDGHTKSQYDVDSGLFKALFSYLGTGGVARTRYFGIKPEGKCRHNLKTWLSNRNSKMRDYYKEKVDNLFKL